ncbi:permease prefix domain 1-containing protein [Peribacillus frigoritolerans]|uniref:permease prefix domain 1-containing protein n=1 Tax=Peribacillus frigoritolerans TaxID=450367 RepID=UPI0030159099|nr:permease prefix domain 1-containing protein [Brevibacterium sp. PAMC21349]
MTQIEAFVNSVYQNVAGNKKEIQELKAEMKSHLLEAVYELKLEGKTEQEAIEIAIERFGGKKEMRSIIGQLFKAQKIFAKRVLYSAVGFLVLSMSFFCFLWQNTQSNANERSIIRTQINDLLENEEVVTSDMKNEIKKLVESTNYISLVKISNVRDVGYYEDYKGYRNIFNYVEQAKPDYQYKRIVWNPEWLGTEFSLSGGGDDQWYVEMESRSFDTLLTVVLFVGVAIYWTLFSIWAIINAYHHKRLNIGWTLTFILFNILGYFVFRFVEKKQFSHL